MIGFQVLARDGSARRGRLMTARGAVETPAFMPVGTAGTVKAMTPEGVAAMLRDPISAVPLTPQATQLSPRRGIPFISRGACDGRRRAETR